MRIKTSNYIAINKQKVMAVRLYRKSALPDAALVTCRRLNVATWIVMFFLKSGAIGNIL